MTIRGALFIYLIGLAGTGKLTIAKAIQRQFDCLLVDNHLINNVVFSLIDPDGVTPVRQEVWSKVIAIRSIALATIRDHSRRNRNFVFTNELLAGNARHEQFFADVRDLAQARGATLLPVRLLIDPEELARRVVSPGRTEAFKDINAAGARERAATCTLLQPAGVDCMNLDVTALTAEEAASRILAHAEAGA